MGYAQRTKGYRIWLIDEKKLVETINVRFDENKRGINFRQKVNSNLGYNLNLPDYYDEDDFDRVKDTLTSPLVLKTSTETPSTSEKPDVSSDNHSLIPCTEVKWIRNISRKVTGSNVYYSIEGEATRLKYFNEIERYCKRHNIEYDPSLFNFRKDNTESQGFSDLSEQQEALMVEVTIPNCYKQAIRSRDASKWHDEMDKEINVMMEDASKTAISCILKQQKPNGNQHPIAFHSRRLRNYEINYTITELECLAIIDSLDKFHCYLHASHFTVHTDHNALVWLKNFKNPTFRLFRWSLKVSMHDFDIKYKKGSTNVEADMLTRNPIAYHIINTPPEPLLDINEISHFQNIENTSAPKCFKRDGVFVVKRQGLTKIIVPKALRVKLMETTHKTFGHPGVATMLKLISPQYYWINIITDIRNYVKHCETCQINKKSHQRKYGLMQSLPFVKNPLNFYR
ncbi:hypothetical protein TNCV_3176192 [Trichonephila clavipes]|nr:hypothetical protein TNCV_3176192 [Trichonephila clavipes]